MGGDFTKRTIWLACLMLVLSTTFALGQGIVTGSIAGTVVDPQKAVVAGAKVDARNVATSVDFKTTTNDQGFFSIRSIPPGTYAVSVDAPNFKHLDIAGVVVNTGVLTDMGALALALGATAETITVEAAAPLIETASAQGGANFSSDTTQNLPLNGAFDNLALYTPGVAPLGNLGQFANSNGAGFSSNGQRDRSNTFQIDGQFNNDTAVTGPAIFFGNQDALQEVQIVTNNFGVEYGRTSGSTVNYITKSGSNSFHGSGFEYFTGNWADSLTLTEALSNGGNGVAARDTENRWGGTLGGPIVPSKIFFFTSFLQDTIKGSSSPSTSKLLTPTPAGLAKLSTCYPGSSAVAALKAIGPYAVTQGNPQPLGAVTPLTLTGGCVVDFAGITRSIPALSNDYEAIGRVDFVLTPRDQLFVRYLFTQPISQPTSTPGQFGTFAEEGSEQSVSRNQQAAVDWTRNWTTHLVNQVRFSYVREVTGFQGGAYPACLLSALGACPTFYAMANGLLAAGQGVNVPQGGTTNNSQWQDNASWQHGRHLIKFGGEYDRQRAPNLFIPFLAGRYTYKFGSGTSIADSEATFNHFLAGTPASIDLTVAPNPVIPFKEQDADLYLGDDWRIKDNLTLNLGVRWEFTQQAYNLLARNTVLQQLGPNPFWDTSLPLSVTTEPIVPNHYKHFAPNFGFAWTPHMLKGVLGENKTVVRGGFRLAYNPAFYNIFLNVATAAPAVNAGTITNAACGGSCPNVITGADAQAAFAHLIPNGVDPGIRFTTRVSPNITNPYAEEWTLGIEREISGRLAGEMRYVGTHTVHEFQTVNGNPELCNFVDAGHPCEGGLLGDFPSLVPKGVTPCLTPGAAGFGGNPKNPQAPGNFALCSNTLFRLRDNGGSARYNSLQAQLKVRGWHGLTAVAAYTFSKNMDNASEIFSTYGPSPIAGPQDPFCTSRCEWGLSGIDYPHNFTLFWNYELPFGRGHAGGLARLLGGWALGGTYRYTSGQLWTPVEDSGTNSACNDAFNNKFFGASSCRPFAGNPAAPVNTVGQCMDAGLPDCGLVDFFTGAPTTAKAVHWILNDDVAATFFKTPFGNIRRNPGVRGQPVHAMNLNLIKNNRISERVNLRLEANVYNALNHLWLGVPSAFFADGKGCFGSLICNDSGGVQLLDSGAGAPGAISNGLAQRRVVLGAHIIF